MRPVEGIRPEHNRSPRNKNVLFNRLVATVGVAVAAPLLLWAATAFGQGQETPPPAPTPTPASTIEAAAVNELNTSGGEVWTGRPVVGTLEIEVLNTDTGEVGVLSASASVANLPDGKGQVVISCQHCFMIEILAENQREQAVYFVGPEGQRVRIRHLFFDNRYPSYINDARVVGVPETPIDFMWPMELNTDIKERLMLGEVINVMVVAHDFNQSLNEFFYATMHRTTDNAGCRVLQMTVTDHACLLGRNLEGIIPGNSGGVILVSPDTNSPQPGSARLEVAAIIRSPHFSFVFDEKWVNNLPALNSCVFQPGLVYNCLTFPLVVGTATPRPEDITLQITATPSPTYDHSKPTPTRTPTRTPRPTTTLVPTPTPTSTRPPYPTPGGGGRGGSIFFLPQVAMGGRTSPVPLPDTAVFAAELQSSVITWTPSISDTTQVMIATPTPEGTPTPGVE